MSELARKRIEENKRTRGKALDLGMRPGLRRSKRSSGVDLRKTGGPWWVVLGTRSCGVEAMREFWL